MFPGRKYATDLMPKPGSRSASGVLPNSLTTLSVLTSGRSRIRDFANLLWRLDGHLRIF